jgi:hypothetical protein
MYRRQAFRPAVVALLPFSYTPSSRHRPKKYDKEEQMLRRNTYLDGVYNDLHIKIRLNVVASSTPFAVEDALAAGELFDRLRCVSARCTLKTGQLPRMARIPVTSRNIVEANLDWQILQGRDWIASVETILQLSRFVKQILTTLGTREIGAGRVSASAQDDVSTDWHAAANAGKKCGFVG